MCFSLGWFEQLCIWLVVIAAVIAVIRLLLPSLTGAIGGSPIVAQIINIALWCVVAIAAIYIIFGLLSCVLTGPGGLHLPR